MSTVSKKIADRVIAGEFPEDGIVAIIKYNNIFNGEDAYKLIFPQQEYLIAHALNGWVPTMLNCSLYWRRED